MNIPQIIIGIIYWKYYLITFCFYLIIIIIEYSGNHWKLRLGYPTTISSWGKKCYSVRLFVCPILTKEGVSKKCLKKVFKWVSSVFQWSFNELLRCLIKVSMVFRECFQVFPRYFKVVEWKCQRFFLMMCQGCFISNNLFKRCFKEVSRYLKEGCFK